VKFACRDIRYITDRLARHEKAFLESFLSGVYASAYDSILGSKFSDPQPQTLIFIEITQEWLVDVQKWLASPTWRYNKQQQG
jgi:hypothetical protein